MTQTMRRTKNASIRQDMEANARACNRFLTKESLRKLSLIGVLRNVHPLDRVDFARKLNLANKLSDHNLKCFTQPKPKQ